MDKCKPTNTPIVVGTRSSKDDVGTSPNSTLYKKLVGSLMYLTTTRPNIIFATSYISKFMQSPKDSHWRDGKRILRYIVGTIIHGLWYTSSEDNVLIGYIDSDFANSIDDIKCTSGYVFLLGKSMISWASKKQPIMLISWAKVEFIAATTTTCHVFWLRRL